MMLISLSWMASRLGAGAAAVDASACSPYAGPCAAPAVTTAACPAATLWALKPAALLGVAGEALVSGVRLMPALAVGLPGARAAAGLLAAALWGVCRAADPPPDPKVPPSLHKDMHITGPRLNQGWA